MGLKEVSELQQQLFGFLERYKSSRELSDPFREGPKTSRVSIVGPTEVSGLCRQLFGSLKMF